MQDNLIKQSLLDLPRRVKQCLMMLLDIFICLLSVWLAFGLKLDQWFYLYGNQWLFFLIAIGFSIPLFIFFGLYRAIFRYVGSAAFFSVVQAFVIYTTIIIFIFTLIGVRDVPRSLGIIQPILMFIGICVSRLFVRYWIGSFSFIFRGNSKGKSKALIFGAGVAGRQLLSSLVNNNELIVMGFIDEDLNLQGRDINGIRVYPLADIQGLIGRLGISDVILAIPSASRQRRRKIIDSLSGCGVRVRTLPALLDIVSGRIKITDLHDLDMNDLLGREVVPPDTELMEKNIHSKVVLVTGAGGSIGSELCRQIIKYSPKSLILLDSSEHSLYLIYEELKQALMSDDYLQAPDNDQASSFLLTTSISLVPCLASVRDCKLMMEIFRMHQPYTVFHTAAYKHVPLVEKNSIEGIRNNVFGTLTCAKISSLYQVNNFILVSTDKAVRPTNVMGASKRIAELVLQGLANTPVNTDKPTTFSIVRFGNVLGSSGSVVPLFSSQIAKGGPITLTHPEVTRYFMTIPEAAQLVIQASAMAVGGDIFVLDMGEPVKIYDLAIKMIFLSGRLIKNEACPYGDIEIIVTGLRPGEKLYEELLIGNNPQPTAHPKIMMAHEEFLLWNDLSQELEKLKLALDECDTKLIGQILLKLVSGYQLSNF